MLKLTKKADYGLIALKHLALQPANASASAKDIADAYGVPLPLLSKILQRLARHRFLQSEHGTNGGYRLARDPGQITALEVIRAIDGPIILTECFTEHGDCLHSTRCSVREPLRRVHEGILRLLDGITILDISRDAETADDKALGCAPGAHERELHELKPAPGAQSAGAQVNSV